MGGRYLGQSGVSHLRQVIQRLPHEPYPVVIEPHEDETLNIARRKFIVDALLSHGIADADHRVIVETPIAEGLRGDEAERIYYQMLIPNQNTRGYNQFGFPNRPYSNGFGFGYGPFGGFGGYGYGAFGAFGVGGW
jgi:hypothetical protein